MDKMMEMAMRFFNIMFIGTLTGIGYYYLAWPTPANNVLIIIVSMIIGTFTSLSLSRMYYDYDVMMEIHDEFVGKLCEVIQNVQEKNTRRTKKRVSS